MKRELHYFLGFPVYCFSPYHRYITAPSCASEVIQSYETTKTKIKINSRKLMFKQS